MENKMTFETFIQHIDVMKPNHINEDNKTHRDKLETMLSSPKFVAENKVDGCHYLNLGYRFVSPDKVEKTNNFPHLRDFFRQLGMANLILDGEINYPEKTSQFCTRITGSSSDVAIKNQQKIGPIHYTIWDILRTPRGTWILNKPLLERRQLLEQFYQQFVVGKIVRVPGLGEVKAEQVIHLTSFIAQGKRQFYEAEISAGREGIVLKSLESAYIMGKRPMWQWMKMKQKDATDLFISGFEPAEINYNGTQMADWPYWMDIRGISRPVSKFHYMGWIGAIELSAFVEGVVTKICTCSGITEELRASISEHPEKYLNRVVRITFMEKTEAGFPRHPRFEGFHETKQAEECAWNFH